VNALGRNFDFSDPTEGEQQLYKVLGRLFVGLLHDVADSISNGCLTQSPTAW
jgi:hypothetical protein